MAKTPKHTVPTWLDHNQLNFWLWACLRNAHAYLSASRNLSAAHDTYFSGRVGEFATRKQAAEILQREEELAKYHFVTAMGVLIRVLDRAQRLFPAIKPSYRQARHLLEEGPEIRNLIEHAPDDYFQGTGTHQARFERDNAPQRGIRADATATIINEEGHWLGGRLCVERIVDEVDAISRVAKNLPEPDD